MKKSGDGNGGGLIHGLLAAPIDILFFMLILCLPKQEVMKGADCCCAGAGKI